MPIYEAANSLIVHFGHGDVLITTGQNVEKPFSDELCFLRDTPHEIGEHQEGQPGQRTDELDCPLRFVFDKTESIDVLIERLETLRAMIVEAKGGDNA